MQNVGAMFHFRDKSCNAAFCADIAGKAVSLSRCAKRVELSGHALAIVAFSGCDHHFRAALDQCSGRHTPNAGRGACYQRSLARNRKEIIEIGHYTTSGRKCADIALTTHRVCMLIISRFVKPEFDRRWLRHSKWW